MHAYIRAIVMPMSVAAMPWHRNGLTLSYSFFL